MTRLLGQVALVTGSGRGIGQAIACAFAREGAHVVVADINAQAVLATADVISSAGGSALAAPTDVTSADDLDRVFARISEQFGRLDILVNNAGIFHVAPLLEFPLD